MKSRFIIFVCLTLALGACVNRYDDVPEGSVSAPVLALSVTSDAHKAPSPDNTALTLSWSAVGSGTVLSLELSSTGTFSNAYVEKCSGTQRTFTFRELNDLLLGRLGMESGIESTLYVRMAASLNEMTEYSNVAEVTVTPGTVINPAVLTCSTTDVVLYTSKPDRLALTLSWTNNGIGVENTIEMSTDRSFALPYSIALGENVHDRQFTAGALNEILSGSLGMEANVQDSLFIRIVSSYTTAAVSSNIVAVAVTPEASGSGNSVAKLYVAGASPADPWNFDDYLLQYNSTTNSYGGVIKVDSKWGYKFYPEFENWDFCYTRASGDALSGTLKQANSSSDNMWAPDAGLYLFDVSLGGFWYKLTKVTSASYTGLNDDWNLKKMTQSADNPTVFTATVTITKPATYRWQVVINNNWDLKFCASFGNLLLYDEGDASEQLPNGTYTLTVDLGTGSYYFTQK